MGTQTDITNIHRAAQEVGEISEMNTGLVPVQQFYPDISCLFSSFIQTPRARSAALSRHFVPVQQLYPDTTYLFSSFIHTSRAETYADSLAPCLTAGCTHLTVLRSGLQTKTRAGRQL